MFVRVTLATSNTRAVVHVLVILRSEEVDQGRSNIDRAAGKSLYFHESHSII